MNHQVSIPELVQADAQRFAGPVVSSRHCGRYMIDVAFDIESFAAEWPSIAELGDRTNGFAFQCRDHLAVWLKTIGSDPGVHPVFVRVGDLLGNPVMLIPLGIERRHGLRVLRFLDRGVCDYNAPVLLRPIDPEEMPFIWSSIREVPEFDVALLEKIPRIVEGIENPFWCLAKEPWPVSGYELSLKGGESVLRGASSFADNRRQRKRLAEIGPLEFAVANSSEDIARIFAVFVRQKSRKYVETETENGLAIPHIRAYYESLAAGRTAGVQLSCLKVGDEIVATHWGMATGKRFYYLMPAFEAGRWRRYSPGRLLMEELIKWSIRNGIEAFDLGVGDEDYKTQWRAQPVALAGGKFPKTLRGRAYCAALNAKGALRNTLPPNAVDFLRRARKSIG